MRVSRWSARSALGLLAVPLLLVGGSTSANAAATSGRTRIAFDRVVAGNNAEILTMRPDGSDQRRLTRNSAGDIEPSYSPDGNKIAFASNRDGDYEIFAMNTDGSALRKLTRNAAGDEYPDYSPNGRKIVFTRSGPHGAAIFSMRSDGSGASRLTPYGGAARTGSSPSFSPTGKRIAFAGPPSVPEAFLDVGLDSLRIMNSDGSGDHAIPGVSASAFEGLGYSLPSFSPSAPLISFTFIANGASIVDVHLIRPDGRPVQGGAVGLQPAFSPGGKQIAYSSVTPTASTPFPFDIFTMLANGSHVQRVTHNAALDQHPDWGRVPVP